MYSKQILWQITGSSIPSYSFPVCLGKKRLTYFHTFIMKEFIQPASAYCKKPCNAFLKISGTDSGKQYYYSTDVILACTFQCGRKRVNFVFTQFLSFAGFRQSDTALELSVSQGNETRCSLVVRFCCFYELSLKATSFYCCFV